MKTAVSLPDPLFAEAERLAAVRGMSRSELYANAIAEYVRCERFQGVRERLDALYQANPAISLLDPGVARFQSASLDQDNW